MNFNLKYIILFVVWFGSINSLNSQYATNTAGLDNSEPFSIIWVKNIPPSKESDKNRKGWFKRLIFGNKNINSFKKPIDLISLNSEECMVLDQGYGTIFIANDKKLSLPRIFKKPKNLFPSLISACILPSNELLFTDSKLNKVFVLSSNKKNIRSLNDELTLNRPTGIAYSSLMKPFGS